MLVQRADLMILFNHIYEENSRLERFEIKTNLSLDGRKDSALVKVELKDNGALVETIDEKSYDGYTYKY